MVVLALVMVLSLCACVSEKEHNAAVQQYENEKNDMQQQIDELQAQILVLKETVENQSAEINAYNEQRSDMENKLASVNWIVSGLESEDYDYILNRIQEMKKQKEREEREAKGILEIEITLENWDQYFEFVPYGYSYIKNSFGETTHINLCGGIKLKDGYVLADDYDTRIAFEASMQWEKRECTVNFATNEISFGEVISTREKTDSTDTMTFGRTQSGVASFGNITQLNNDKENAYTREVEIVGVTEVIRVQGTLYIYGN